MRHEALVGMMGDCAGRESAWINTEIGDNFVDNMEKLIYVT